MKFSQDDRAFASDISLNQITDDGLVFGRLVLGGICSVTR